MPAMTNIPFVSQKLLRPLSEGKGDDDDDNEDDDDDNDDDGNDCTGPTAKPRSTHANDEGSDTSYGG